MSIKITPSLCFSGSCITRMLGGTVDHCRAPGGFGSGIVPAGKEVCLHPQPCLGHTAMRLGCWNCTLARQLGMGKAGTLYPVPPAAQQQQWPLLMLDFPFQSAVPMLCFLLLRACQELHVCVCVPEILHTPA